MRQITEMEAEQIYIIAGASTANAAFFELESDCKTFLKLADKYLADYMEINGFQNDKEGWAMIITTKSAGTIRESYQKRRARSTKCKESCAHDEIWRILSDQIRILLSTYVKSTNIDRGRVGGKVRGSYKRYVFESVEEAIEMKKSFANHQYNQSQPQERYQPSSQLYEVTATQQASSVYMSCGRENASSRLSKLGFKCFNLILKLTDVLRQLIQTTFDHHFPALEVNSS